MTALVAEGIRPRVALVSVRFTLFDGQMGADFPTRMRAHSARSAALLGEHFDVVEMPLIESEANAASVARQLWTERPDAIVFAPAMAAPPTYAGVALGASDAPVVVWNAPSVLALPDDLHQDEATVHSTTVGALMYANVLVRAGRSPTVVTAAHDDPAALDILMRTVRAAAAAGSLRGTTFLRVGDSIPGYQDVEASLADLAVLGVAESAVGPSEWEDAVAATPEGHAATFMEDLYARGWSGDPGPDAAWSARIAIAIGTLMDRTNAVGGTVNCHSEWFRQSEVIGLTACLAVACQTELGRPLSCTGDQPTGVCLALARKISGAALYCETYVPEVASGLMLIAAGGEGDPAWADPPGAVRLESNDHYPGRRGRGTSVAFGLRREPATLMSLSPTHDGWVLAWAPGEVVESRYANMRGPNGMFRFDSGPASTVISAWIASGANHHNALARGRLDVEVPALAAALGVRAVRV